MESLQIKGCSAAVLACALPWWRSGGESSVWSCFLHKKKGKKKSCFQSAPSMNFPLPQEVLQLSDVPGQAAWLTVIDVQSAASPRLFFLFLCCFVTWDTVGVVELIRSKVRVQCSINTTYRSFPSRAGSIAVGSSLGRNTLEYCLSLINKPGVWTQTSSDQSPKTWKHLRNRRAATWHAAPSNSDARSGLKYWFLRWILIKKIR